MYHIWIGIMGYYGQPKSLSEFNLYTKQVSELKRWLSSIRDNTDTGQRTAFLIGPSGTGKTTLVQNLYQDFGYDMVEFTPDPSNTHKVEMQRLNSILSAGNVMMMIGGKKKGVLFDDIEVGATSERGFLNDVLAIAEKRVGVKGNPVIFTLNSSVKSKRLVGIEKHSLCVNLYRPSSYEMFGIGRAVCERISLELQDHRIQYLANRCQGDLRKLHDAIDLIRKQKNDEDEIVDSQNSVIEEESDRTSTPISSATTKNKLSSNSENDVPPIPDLNTLHKIPILGRLYYYQPSNKHCWTCDTHQYFGIWNPQTPPKLVDSNTVETTKFIENPVIHSNDKEAWNVLSLKDLRFSPLKSIEKYLLPTSQLDNYVFDSIFHSDPLFAPANVYENSWQVLKAVRYKTEQERLQTYQVILSSLCDWSSFESSYIEPFSYVLSDYSAFAGISKPMIMMRNARKQYPYGPVTLKTSNIYSRISQASFNWRSMSELSTTLRISRTEFHEFSYITAKILSCGKKGVEELGQYLYQKGIASNDLDRILRYNCISPFLDKLFPSKKRTSVRKILNGKNKKGPVKEKKKTKPRKTTTKGKKQKT